MSTYVYIYNNNYYYIYLRAAAPAADPGKESGIAGETGKPCDEKFWQMHHHMQDHARRAMCVTGAAFGSIAVRCWLTPIPKRCAGRFMAAQAQVSHTC